MRRADEAIGKLVELVTDEPRTILDVGCGTGDLARRLVDEVERVDAVDFSRAMLDRGRTLPGGDHPHLHWVYGRVEEVKLQPSYALITAGGEPALDGMGYSLAPVPKNPDATWISCYCRARGRA